MTPALVEKYRAAKDLIVTLRASGAKEVRKSWAEIFGKDASASRGAPPQRLIEEIAAELQERIRREVHGVTRVKVVGLKGRARGRV